MSLHIPRSVLVKFGNPNKKKGFPKEPLLESMEAPPRFELGIKDLQSSALPLGYGAMLYAGPERPIARL